MVLLESILDEEAANRQSRPEAAVQDASCCFEEDETACEDGTSILAVSGGGDTTTIHSVGAFDGGGNGSIRGKSDVERELKPLFRSARGNGGASEQARTAFDYWTPARVANAVPRDLHIDKQTGKAYMKDFGTAQRSNGKPRTVYALKEYGKKPERGLLEDNANVGRNLFSPPDFTNMEPVEGAEIDVGSSFFLTIDGPVQSAKTYIRYPSGAVGSFDMGRVTGTTNVCGVSLTGFTDGDWTWWAWAKYRRTTGTSDEINFTVDTGGSGGGGGGGGGTCSSLTDCDFTTSTAEGFCHYMYDHPSIKNAEYVGGRILFTMGSSDYICSGTVVADGVSGRSIVLTAAHCVYDDSNKAFATNGWGIP